MCTTKISLFFQASAGLTLEKTKFEHSAVGVRECTRGRIGIGTCGSFQWSSAVQSLAFLVVQSAANSKAPESYPTLRGDKGSPAASLDYAMGKSPNWIIDMFGLDFVGQPLAKRVIRRMNPERKRPGPVTVYLSEALLVHGLIEVYIGEQRIVDTESLTELAQRIEGECFHSPLTAAAA